METKNELIFKIMSYSQSPGPRYCDQGDDSGEDFYHSILNYKFYQAYNEKKTLIIDLDGPDGYASSFLDEAFGNLVYDFGKKLVENILKVKSEEEPEWIEMLNDTYEEWEKRRKGGKAPKITIEHPEWYRFMNNKLMQKQWIHLSSGK
jgi:hypothetical protein bacD2_23454